jgi:ribosome-associated heat shock protein Hsp15
MSGQEDTQEDQHWQRLDRWLWCARFLKTRALAARFAEQGKVRINRLPTDKPHARVRPGDVLTFGMGPSVRVIRVTALGDRRGPAQEARGLYEDLDPPTQESVSQG